MQHLFPTEDNLREEWKAEIGKVLGKGSNWKVEKKDYVQFAFSGWQKTWWKQDSNHLLSEDKGRGKTPILESEKNDDVENENQNPLVVRSVSKNISNGCAKYDTSMKLGRHM